MMNPLHKRIPRELTKDAGKYVVIFLFVVLLISLVTGFLIADKSLQVAYDESFEKYNVEDGHITFDSQPTSDLIETIEYKSDVTMVDMSYKDLPMTYAKAEASNPVVRVYPKRTEVNIEAVLDGNSPESESEIALDRLFAEHNNIEIGDEIEVGGQTLRVSGIVALPDYSSLFENNSDMMFDSLGFGVAVVTDKCYDVLPNSGENYNYAWTYSQSPADSQEEQEMSEELLENIVDVLSVYNERIASEQIEERKARAEAIGAEYQEEIFKVLLRDEDAVSRAVTLQKELEAIRDEELDETGMIGISDYVMRGDNQAIVFAGDDIGKDKVMFLVFDYIVTVMLAFIFAITISGTIAAEAGTIGTLRASGYTRWELVRHYMVLPCLITVVAALIGNVLGYTVLKGIMADMYRSSYSLGPYETVWSTEAFVLTTVVSLVLMFVINFVMLVVKLRLSPLKFLRHELGNRQRKLSMPLSKKIPFSHRFRIRILLQNSTAYATLFIGIFLAGAVAVFGTMFGPLLDDYSGLIKESQISEYQYVIKDTEATTTNEQAEKYSIASLETEGGQFQKESITIYGIAKDSEYISSDIPEGQVLLSNGYMEKYGYKKGDSFTLMDPYTEDEYEFTIGGEYKYDAGIVIFMNSSEFNQTFGYSDEHFSGYFSNERLTDINEDDIATIITSDDLNKIATQLKISMGNFMTYVQYFAIILFLLMMYILTKHIIERNALSIAMTKILGYSNKEIAGLYIVITSIVVVASLLISIPIIHKVMELIFTDYIYRMMTGYIPYIVDNSCYIKMFLMGICSYAVVAVLLMVKISKISKSNALKSFE